MLITRFAPSPNGDLHLGHALSALCVDHWAKVHDASVILRIEDIDFNHCQEKYTARIVDDLLWLGFGWASKPLRQSVQKNRFSSHIDKLKSLGLLYPCHASRGDIQRYISQQKSVKNWQCDPDGSPIYPGIWRPDNEVFGQNASRFASSHKEPAWRLDMGKAIEIARQKCDIATGNQREPKAEAESRHRKAKNLENHEGALSHRFISWCELGRGPNGEQGALSAKPETWGDVVLVRRDIGLSYHLAVVVDDADQDVSHVIRGQDLFYATSLHRLLQVLLDIPPPRYIHHPLMLDQDGKKLSKSLSSKSLRDAREEGMSAVKILDKLARILHRSGFFAYLEHK